MRFDDRAKPRRRLRYQAWIKGEDGASDRRCNLEDVSEGGARLRIDDGEAVPATFNLKLSATAAPRPCRVIWRSATEVGLRFDTPATRINGLLRPLPRCPR
jgi:hypothetical protein